MLIKIADNMNLSIINNSELARRLGITRQALSNIFKSKAMRIDSKQRLLKELVVARDQINLAIRQIKKNDSLIEKCEDKKKESKVKVKTIS